VWGEEEDIETLGFSGELSLPLAEKLVLQLAAAQVTDQLSGAGGFDETTLKAGVALTWAATRNLFVVGRASLAERDTDRNVFFDDREYERTAFSVGVLWMR
jgi:hypothetical protein